MRTRVTTHVHESLLALGATNGRTHALPHCLTLVTQALIYTYTRGHTLTYSEMAEVIEVIGLLIDPAGSGQLQVVTASHTSLLMF